MHPLDNRQFGPETGKIAVTYHNGTAVVVGYVVKQIGSHRYRVSDGTTTRDIVIAQTLDAAQNLVSGVGTFVIATESGNKYAARINSAMVVTVDGIILRWREAVVAAGKCRINQVGDVDGGETLPPNSEGALFYAQFAQSIFYSGVE